MSFLLCHFHIFGSTWYLSVHLVELSYHPLLVSLILSSWKTFPKSHLRKFLKLFYFLRWFNQSPSKQWDKVFETSNRKYLLQFIKRRSKVYKKNMSHQNTLKFNQSKTFSKNDKQIRLWLRLVSLGKPIGSHWFKMSCLTCLVFNCVYYFFLKRGNFTKTFVLHEEAVLLPKFLSHRLTS